MWTRNSMRAEDGTNCVQILQGLKYIHNDLGICHGNLTCSTFLVNDEVHIKICELFSVIFLDFPTRRFGSLSKRALVKTWSKNRLSKENLTISRPFVVLPAPFWVLTMDGEYEELQVSWLRTSPAVHLTRRSRIFLGADAVIGSNTFEISLLKGMSHRVHTITYYYIQEIAQLGSDTIRALLLSHEVLFYLQKRQKIDLTSKICSLRRV